MSRTRIDAAALLLGTVVAGVGLLAPASANLSYLTGAFGLTAVLVLLAFDREGYRSVFESIAYSAVVGLCLVMPVSLLLGLAGMTFDGVRHLIVWVVAIVVFVAVDRARMSGRVEQPATDSFIRPSAPAYTPPPVAQPIYAPQPMAATPPSAYGTNYPYAAAASAPAPVAAPPALVYAPPPPPPPAPVYAPPPAQVSAFAPPPPPATPAPERVSIVPEPQPVVAEAVAPPVAAQPAPAPTSPASIPNFTAPLPPVPVQPPANSLPVPAGKEAMIYVNLKDEGLNVLRSVRAEHLGRDYYRIVEEMPPGETWEFQQGQIVKCVKKKLSSGKAMVATEEAPRAR